MPINIKYKDVSQKWLNNIGTGYMLQKFPFGNNSIVCKDHFESVCYKVDKVIRFSVYQPSNQSISEWWGSLLTHVHDFSTLSLTDVK